MLTSKQRKSILRQTDRKNMLKKVFNIFAKKKSLLFLLSLILIIVFVITLANSFAADVEIKNMKFIPTKLSIDNEEYGSWYIDVNAKWVSKDTARVTLDLDTIGMTKESKPIDLVLLVDDSITNVIVKGEIRNFCLSFLNKNTSNSISIIRFNSVAERVSDFGTDITALNDTEYGNLDGSTGLSYYQAIQTLSDFLYEETFNLEHDLEVVLITDGAPGRDIGKEKLVYDEIRSDFPELKNFFAVQYKTNGKENDILREISDTQYIATTNKNFNRILNNIINMQTYVDYDFFNFDVLVNTDVFSIDNVMPSVTYGKKRNVIGARMIWFFGNEGTNNRLASNSTATMSFDLKLKDKYLGKAGLYPLFKKASINYKIGDVSEMVVSTDTPILSNVYAVSYDGNAPSGCMVSNLPETLSNHVFTVVKISDKIPVCNGYKFNGWEIVNSSVVRKGNSFVMPTTAATLKATWSKASMNKTMDGTIYKSATLYDTMADNATLDTNLSFTNTSSTYNGIYTRKGTTTDTYPIHYYHGSVTNNNLLFAGFCWKIVRTTSTGGVKIIYNGLPNSSNQCTNTTGNIGSGVFNSNNSSIASVGYMYGDLVQTKTYTVPEWYELLGLSVKTWDMTKTQTMGTKNYYFTSTYTSLQRNVFEGTWILNNATQAAWSTSYINRYTCLDGSSTCSEPVYIVGGNSKEAIYVPITLEASASPTYSSGKYAVAEYIGKDPTWASKYYSLRDKYVCGDGSISCSEVYYVISYSSGVIKYISLTGGTMASTLKTQADNKKIVFGNWEQWDGTQYGLNETVSLSITNLYNELLNLKKGYNYTCLSEEKKCASVKYLLYYERVSSNKVALTYVDLDAYNLLAFKEARVFKNTNNSNAKNVVDNWYRNKMTSYTKYLEDTVFCNDREVKTGAFSSENSKINNISLGFAGTSSSTSPPLTCNNSYDNLTTTNGLTYPVGLITYGEILLGGYSSSASYFGSTAFWSMTPRTYYDTAGMYVYNYNSGSSSYWDVNKSYAFRPVVSIKPGMKIDGGNGSSTKPYTLQTS